MIRQITSDDPAFETMIGMLREANLPTDDLSDFGANFFAYGDTDAFAGIVIMGTSALLRSLVVRVAKRGRGYAGEMLNSLIAIARQRGADEVWLLTVSAQELFGRHGFEPVDRSIAPGAIASTKLFRDHCPATAVLMRRDLQ